MLVTPSGTRLPAAFAAIDAARRVLRRALLSDVPCLNGLTWTRVGWTFALAAALSLYSTPSAVLDTVGSFAAPIGLYVEGFLFFWFPNYLLAFVTLMLCGTLADSLPLRGWARTSAFAAALALSLLAIAPEQCLLLRWIFGEACEGFPSWRIFLATLSSFGASMLMFALVIGAAWFAHRRDAALAAKLHAAEMDRISLQRRTVETGLNAMQARIDPAFLLDTLTEVSIRCEKDAAIAERTIDELVTYLRAVLPDLRDEGSTLGRELRMAGAYLALAGLRSDGRVQYAIDASESLMPTRMAPMLLMPLLASITAQEPIAQRGAMTIRIEASVVDNRLQVDFSWTGAAPRATAGHPIIVELRARLQALYGAAAWLAVDAGSAKRASAVLVLPRESASSMDEDRVAGGESERGSASLRRDPAHQGA